MKKTMIWLSVFMAVLVAFTLAGKFAQQKLDEIQKEQRVAQPAR